jgi:xylulokinase
MEYLIGIDIGTTGAKTVIFGADGSTVASAFEEYPLRHPRPGWAEQNPQDWWEATVKSIRRVLQTSRISLANLRGLSLSGQMHGAVLLGRDHQVLRPCIIWSDQRSAAQAEWINQTVGRERLLQIACNPALTGFTAPKALWVRDNEPEVWDQVATLFLPKDYEIASEVSDDAGTLLFDVHRRRWSDELCRLMGIPREWLPKVYESIDVAGQITQEVADLTGLPVNLPVVAGGADNTCGAVGNGIVHQGLVSSSIGTSGVVFAHTDQVRMDPLGRVHTFNHSVPNKWYLMGVTQGAGISLRWLRDQFGAIEREAARLTREDPYDILMREAATAPTGSEGLIFAPYLQGERTPHLDPEARGVLFGLTARHERRHVVRSILEGVAYSLRDSFEIIKEQGISITQVRATGGGARSPLWRQIQSDIFGSELVTVNTTEGPAFGAALLAAVGVGIYSTVEEACDVTVKVTHHISPIPAHVERYNRYYPIYRALYPSLKDLMHQTGEIVAHEGVE